VGGSNATSLVVARPSGIVAGDVLIASVTVNTAATIVAPVGWVQVATVANGTAERASTWWKVAGGSEPTSYTFTWSEPAGLLHQIRVGVGACRWPRFRA
jgi:hypothetical protein